LIYRGEHGIYRTDIIQVMNERIGDVCFIGLDLLLNKIGSDIVKICDLNFGLCKMVIASKEDDLFETPDSLANKTIASKYNQLVMKYFKQLNIPLSKVIKMDGALELAPNIGIADAIVDIVGFCLLVNMLELSEITASPIHVGSGFVKCEHGLLPVPAPATAEILKGVPIYGGRIRAELCTPTGAAILKHFVKRFGEMAPMVVQKVGYGMGTKDFEAANCVRAYLYEKSESENSDIVYEISCNLDDMTPEAIGAAVDVLLKNGALDVYTTPVTMKKNRPAVVLTCIVAKNKRDIVSELMLEHTTTLGVRMSEHSRILLSRGVFTVNTPYGEIRVKRSEGYGVTKYKPEYDDVSAAAALHSVPFMTVYNSVLAYAK